MGFKKKVLIVFGTRPEALKMVPLIKELKKFDADFETRVCVTAQHRDMLDQVLDTFSVTTDYDLDLMSKNQTLSTLTQKILLNIEGVIESFKPNLVFVHGDTTTTFAVSLACFYNKINVAHVEAGLRTYDLYSPWPEEFNRQATSKLSLLHFAPTVLSKNNLINEKIESDKVIVTGNTIIDALFMALEILRSTPNFEKQFLKKHNFNFENKIVLITGHRRENFGEGFINICNSIKILSEKFNNVNFVYPLHLNPNVKDVVQKKLHGIKNVHLIRPLEYLDFIFLMSNSYIILTDSGGIQEEAPSLNKPVLVMRNTTERPEALKFDKVKLVGTNSNKIIDEVSKLILDSNYYQKFLKNANPYGEGKAANKIVQYLINNKDVYT